MKFIANIFLMETVSKKNKLLDFIVSLIEVQETKNMEYC